MASYTPDTARREAAIQAGATAVLFIDTQKFNCSKDGAIFRSLTPGQQEDCAYFWENLEKTIPRWQTLQKACRDGGVEVMYTVIQSLTKDGRDMSLDYKISGFHVPPGSPDAEVLEELKPGEDEIVLPKTSCNVFVSTNIDYVLRCLGVRSLILCGCVTDQCVDAAVRSACDLGYLVTLLPDCCVTYSQERHDNALSALGGFCRQRTLSELISEMQRPCVSSRSGNGRKRQKRNLGTDVRAVSSGAAAAVEQQTSTQTPSETTTRVPRPAADNGKCSVCGQSRYGQDGRHPKGGWCGVRQAWGSRAMCKQCNKLRKNCSCGASQTLAKILQAKVEIGAVRRR